MQVTDADAPDTLLQDDNLFDEVPAFVHVAKDHAFFKKGNPPSAAAARAGVGQSSIVNTLKSRHEQRRDEKLQNKRAKTEQANEATKEMKEFFVAQTAAVKTVSQLAVRRFDLDVLSAGIKMNFKREILEARLEKLLSTPLEEENNDKKATGPAAAIVINDDNDDDDDDDDDDCNVNDIKSGSEVDLTDQKCGENHMEPSSSISSNGFLPVETQPSRTSSNGFPVPDTLTISSNRFPEETLNIGPNGFPVGVCCVGDHLCKYPTLELRPQHKCSSCDKIAHVLCAVVDGENDEIECKMCRSILE